MSWLNYIPAKLKAVISGGYGRLYNWFCTQPQTKVKYGYLYNWYAATDVRNIANVGAHVPTVTEFETLRTFLDPNNGAKLCDTGIIYWSDAVANRNNLSGYTARGSGSRTNYDGSFETLRTICHLWTTTIDIYGYTKFAQIQSTGLSIGHTSGTKIHGYAIRLIIDNPIEIIENKAIYVGNDGRRYKCVLIGDQWWLAENLAETKYRNGDLITKVIDDIAWTQLITEAMCAYNNLESNVFETASIAPVGWHVPTDAEYTGLKSPYGYMAAPFKEVGLLHWDTPNDQATNTTGFNAVGIGQRVNAIFGMFKKKCPWWTTDFSGDNATANWVEMQDVNQYFSYGMSNKKDGYAIRLIKDDSTWTAGDTLIDIDGNVYPTVKIGTQVYTAMNWKCTKLNDGTPIPLITDNAAWAATTEMAQCIYDNNPLNL